LESLNLKVKAKIFGKFGSYTPNDIASYPRRLERTLKIPL
jgi:hypothetical protein